MEDFFSIETTYSSELHSVVIPVPVHPNTNCSSDYVLFWNKAPEPRITTVSSIIAHNKVMPSGMVISGIPFDWPLGFKKYFMWL